MSAVSLFPLPQCCPSVPLVQTATYNPPMGYDSTLGTPAAQGIVPPFPNMLAHIDDTVGSAKSYVWNINTQAWH